MLLEVCKTVKENYVMDMLKVIPLFIYFYFSLNKLRCLRVLHFSNSNLVFRCDCICMVLDCRIIFILQVVSSRRQMLESGFTWCVLCMCLVLHLVKLTSCRA